MSAESGRSPVTPAWPARRCRCAGADGRWASASPDGDLTGASRLAIDLIGTGQPGLADRRGECIHSACGHHKCFVERSVRTARQADIVIANHAGDDPGRLERAR